MGAGGETSTLAEAIVATFESLISNIHTCLPGKIESYDYKKQMAVVKPLLKKKFLDGDVLELSPIANVPVVFPRTAKSGVTFPMNAGDGVLLVFSERSLERWLSSGKDSEPGDRRKFDLSDAIAIPGCFSFASENLASNNDDLEVHHEGQKVTIAKNGDIKIGVGSLKKLVNEEFKAIFDNHVHNVSVAGTATAQAGVSSSPVSSIPGSPILKPPVGTPILLTYGQAVPASNLTGKVTAQ